MRYSYPLRSLTVVLWTVIGIMGCATQKAAEEGPQEEQAADTPPVETTTVPAEAPRDTEPAAGMHTSDLLEPVGRWSLEPSSQLGIRLTVTIDSAVGGNLFGRLTEYFSGNVGADPSMFRPFEGTVSGDGAVSIPITLVDLGRPGLALVGQLGGDTIHLTMLALGPDTVSGARERLVLVRR